MARKAHTGRRNRPVLLLGGESVSEIHGTESPHINREREVEFHFGLGYTPNIFLS